MSQFTKRCKSFLNNVLHVQTEVPDKSFDRRERFGQIVCAGRRLFAFWVFIGVLNSRQHKSARFVSTLISGTRGDEDGPFVP
jgi:hypothetical protein